MVTKREFYMDKEVSRPSIRLPCSRSGITRTRKTKHNESINLRKDVYCEQAHR